MCDVFYVRPVDFYSLRDDYLFYCDNYRASLFLFLMSQLSCVYVLLRSINMACFVGSRSFLRV